MMLAGLVQRPRRPSKPAVYSVKPRTKSSGVLGREKYKDGGPSSRHAWSEVLQLPQIYMNSSPCHQRIQPKQAC